MADTRHALATYDPGAGVWWAESEDLPGLVSGAPTLDALVDRMTAVVSELLVASGTASTRVSLQFSVTQRIEPA